MHKLAVLCKLSILVSKRERDDLKINNRKAIHNTHNTHTRTYTYTSMGLYLLRFFCFRLIQSATYIYSHNITFLDFN
jgi:hypothetical protein